MQTAPLTPSRALRGFLIATAAFLAVFAAGSAPIPLYTVYERTFGLSNADINVAMLLYLGGIMAVLLFAGRLSDALGRRPTVFAALVTALMGCVLFILADSAGWVMAGRTLQGVSCGLAMSAVSSSVIDCANATGSHASWGSVIASCGSLIGIMAGSLLCGAITSAIPQPSAVFGIFIALLLALMVATPAIPETVRQRTPLASAVHPRLVVPAGSMRLFVVASIAYSATWGVGGFFQSYSAPIAAETLHVDSTLLASAILSCAMAPSALGGPLTGRLSARRALVLGAGTFLASCVLMTVFLAISAIVPFLLSCAFFSLAMGVCLSASLRMLLAAAPQRDTAGVVSSINLAGYVGCTIICCGAGTLCDACPFPFIFGIFTVMAVVASGVMLGILRPARSLQPAGTR